MESKEKLTQNFNVTRVANGFILRKDAYIEMGQLSTNDDTFVFRDLRELAIFIENLDEPKTK